jgi:hypothetical protein
MLIVNWRRSGAMTEKKIDGDQPLVASVSGSQTQANIFITVLK